MRSLLPRMRMMHALALVLVLALVAMVTMSAIAMTATTTATATTPSPLPLDDWINFATTQYDRAFGVWRAKPTAIPLAAYPTQPAWSTTSNTAWTPGFFPGSYWQLYAATRNLTFADYAAAIQPYIAVRANDTSTHDVGFIIFNTFALGYELTGDDTFLPVVRDAALSLASRFSPIVGCTRSWNSDSGFLVVIDNMMNIELLFWAAAQFGNATWQSMAWHHANRTMHEHFRADGSTYHVVEYNETTGGVVRRYTAQGYADWSTWARGQSWAIYGFATAYQYTGNDAFLNTSIRAADLYLTRLDAEVPDSVPYWDFDAPHTNVSNLPPRDTSSAAAAALGLIRLSQLLSDAERAQYYIDAATRILGNLSSPAYSLLGHPEYPLPALLTQSVGSFPGKEQVDQAIVFGDFYYLRAINAYAALNGSGEDQGDVRERKVGKVEPKLVVDVEIDMDVVCSSDGNGDRVCEIENESVIKTIVDAASRGRSSSVVARLGRSGAAVVDEDENEEDVSSLLAPIEQVTVVDVASVEAAAVDLSTAEAAAASIDLPGMFKFAAVQYTRTYFNWLLNEQDYPDYGYPATNSTWIPTTPVKPFVAGFFAGVLWNLYAWYRVNNSDTMFLEWAQLVQVGNAPVANVTWTHDVGFVIMSTYGLGYELTQNDTFLPVIEQGAYSLSTRYSPIVHCTRSWNNDTDFWVIIDNMMNLELLYWAGEQFGNATWTNMAWQHANRTMFEHFREDNSTWHVVEYNDTTGAVVRKHTNQGYADWSTWARGQSWAIYGFTMSYRYTQYVPFLDKAVGAAHLFLTRLAAEVDDWVPYWDFDAPYEKMWEPRDSSAAAITSSALFELSTHVTDTNTSQALYDAAVTILASLSSYNYSLNGHAEYQLPALLAHATGNYPKHMQIDVALCYGEYYYMEALTRYAASLEGGREGVQRTLMGAAARSRRSSSSDASDAGDASAGEQKENAKDVEEMLLRAQAELKQHARRRPVVDEAVDVKVA